MKQFSPMNKHPLGYLPENHKSIRGPTAEAAGRTVSTGLFTSFQSSS